MNISINGRTCMGRWYPRPDRYVIFINKIAEIHNPIYSFDSFIAEFLATEFHELGHIYGFKSGCKQSHLCSIGLCFWCFYSDIMFMWFKYGEYCETFKSHVKGKVAEINDYK